MSTLFAVPDIRCERRHDGSLLLRSAEPLGNHPDSVTTSFRQWVRRDPEHLLAAERNAAGRWRSVSYAEAERAALAIGQGLLERGLAPHRPLLVVSGNSVNHLLVMLGATLAGVPVAPTSVAYATASRDHSRLREVTALVKPGAVFAEDAETFGPALDALDGVPVVLGNGLRPGATPLDELVRTEPGQAVEDAFQAIDGDTVAKLLFTSGSTGTPKAVITTHGMLAANQQMIAQSWPFLADERPVIVDWLPWSHTFGGSHNLNLVLTHGGTIYVDDGRPAPALFDKTLANLADVPPTIYFNVPAGYARLVPALEADSELASRFFSRLRLLFDAAAALPPELRERLLSLSRSAAGHDVPMTGSWGLTETAPAATSAHFDYDDSRCIGVPLAGAELLLVPTPEQAGSYEIRVRGPMVTPGYYGRADLTSASFDEHGFYRTGDAVQPVDPAEPNRGLLFGGRLAEDFKLATGTFVRVAAVRAALLSACPLVSDVVVAGEHRDYVAALAWLDAAAAAKLLGHSLDNDSEVERDPDLLAELGSQLSAQEAIGSAGHVQRLLVMTRPADLDAGEITDKGYVNQRQVLRTRAHLVDALYADPVGPGVVTVAGG
ncbi:MAG TPA: feruloyl-CoA synthase [Nocardioidaceae bacterium]|nr:feruloyl-CoA synthase [Nocardioidaceae bacterium]